MEPGLTVPLWVGITWDQVGAGGTLDGSGLSVLQNSGPSCAEL